MVGREGRLATARPSTRTSLVLGTVGGAFAHVQTLPTKRRPDVPDAAHAVADGVVPLTIPRSPLGPASRPSEADDAAVVEVLRVVQTTTVAITKSQVGRGRPQETEDTSDTTLENASGLVSRQAALLHVEVAMADEEIDPAMAKVERHVAVVPVAGTRTYHVEGQAPIATRTRPGHGAGLLASTLGLVRVTTPTTKTVPKATRLPTEAVQVPLVLVVVPFAAWAVPRLATRPLPTTATDVAQATLGLLVPQVAVLQADLEATTADPYAVAEAAGPSAGPKAAPTVAVPEAMTLHEVVATCP